MGLWPFGRGPADIELASRVVTAATQSGHRVRGKLTIHFVEPQRKEDADLAADRCAAIAVALLREQPDHGRVIGAEAQLTADLTARYPGGIARARAVELAAFHVVGDPALSDELRRASGTMAAVALPPGPPPGSVHPPPAAPTSRPPPAATPPSSRPPASPHPSWSGATPTPPAAAVGPAYRPTPSGGIAAPYRPTPSGGIPAVPGPMRRRGSSQIRSIQSLLMPPGTSPTAMGQFVAPLARDSAARLLVGFLRVHDLIAVRRVNIDETSAEMLATLVPVSDAPPGGYEASRAGEIGRWQAALGQEVVRALQREARVVSAYLAKEALARIDVLPALADAVLDALCVAAFPDEAEIQAALSRYPIPMPDDFVPQLARTLSEHAGTGDDPAVASALKPLVATVQEDFFVSAMIIKQSSGG